MSDKLTELFDQLYCDNQAKVYKLALGLIGDANDAEDITQEAFFRAFRSYHTFREESSFFTWIYRITLNVANDYLKQRAKLKIFFHFPIFQFPFPRRIAIPIVTLPEGSLHLSKKIIAILINSFAISTIPFPRVSIHLLTVKWNFTVRSTWSSEHLLASRPPTRMAAKLYTHDSAITYFLQGLYQHLFLLSC